MPKREKIPIEGLLDSYKIALAEMGYSITTATPQDNPLYSKLNSTRYTISDEDTLKKLAGLR